MGFYEMLIIARVILSWVPVRQGGLLYDIVAVLDSVTGPYLNLFRRIIPPMGGVDFSPVIALLALNLAERLVFNIIL
ncbi:YggT family protein [Candidatus Collinsella stercoripullorum]|uniref:YggT family protein n=1 Tax=Candidatus Collinsella stercoripullorum TaxID=2838522 RepID=UPI0022E721A0|nr:YggT family protein [Candidatus Collinsella stercoripullorum]